MLPLIKKKKAFAHNSNYIENLQKGKIYLVYIS